MESSDDSAPVTRLLGRPAVAVGLVFGAAFLLCAYYTSRVSEWVVMTDELQYVKLAISIGETLSPVPRIHGDYTGSLSQLYPLLTAPVYQLLPMPDAFRAVHVLNAALIASTAVPVYLLARDLRVPHPLALFAAAGSVIVPWLALAAMVLTEVVAYPAFAWALLAVQRAIAEPSLRRDLVAVIAVAVAFFARTQLVVLVAIVPASIVAHEVAFSMRGGLRGIPRRLWRAVRAHRALVAIAVVALGVAVALAAVGRLDLVLGRYGPTATQGPLLPAGVASHAAAAVAWIAVALGVLPAVLALAWILQTLLRVDDKPGHAFATLAAISIVLLALQASSFDIRVDGEVRDRYLFYLAPILIVGMAVALARLERPGLHVPVAGVAVAWLVGVAEYAPTPGPFFDRPSSALHNVIAGRTYQLNQALPIDGLTADEAVRWGALALAAVVASAFAFAPRRLVVAACCTAVLVFGAVSSAYVLQRVVLGSNEDRVVSGTSTDGRDWVDAAVPEGADVGLVPAPIRDPRTSQIAWWDVEFWNKSVVQTFDYRGSAIYTPFSVRSMEVDEQTGTVRGDDPTPYLVVTPLDVRVRLRGRVVARRGDDLELVMPDRPYRADWIARSDPRRGLTRIRLFRHGTARALRVAITLEAAAAAPAAQRYRLAASGRSRAGAVRPSRTGLAAIEACLRPRRLFTQVRLRRPRRTYGRAPALQVVRISVTGARARCRAAAAPG